jgi:tetratricopeptide (TPR) repeat protein
MDRFEEGIAALNEAIRITPDNAKAHYNLGLAYANLEQFEESITAYQTALQHDPNLVYTYFDLAIIYTWLEQPAKAVANFESYLEMVPNADNREAIETEIARLNELVAMEESLASGGTVDFTDPVSVLEALFFAAATGDYTILAGLCDPLGENDGDTAYLCEITAEHEAAEEFKTYFANGRITGEPLIDGDFAELPFLFGPDGDDSETMNFIQRDGKWYLYDY